MSNFDSENKTYSSTVEDLSIAWPVNPKTSGEAICKIEYGKKVINFSFMLEEPQTPSDKKIRINATIDTAPSQKLYCKGIIKIKNNKDPTKNFESEEPIFFKASKIFSTVSLNFPVCDINEENGWLLNNQLNMQFQIQFECDDDSDDSSDVSWKSDDDSILHSNFHNNVNNYSNKADDNMTNGSDNNNMTYHSKYIKKTISVDDEANDETSSSGDDDSSSSNSSDDSDGTSVGDSWIIPVGQNDGGKSLKKSELYTYGDSSIHLETLLNDDDDKPLVINFIVNEIPNEFNIKLKITVFNRDQDKYEVQNVSSKISESGDVVSVTFPNIKHSMLRLGSESGFVKNDSIMITFKIRPQYIRRQEKTFKRYNGSSYSYLNDNNTDNIPCLNAYSIQVETKYHKLPKNESSASSNSSVYPGLNNNTIRENSKESTKYVGLKNQGATCYMNSMLQALFHLPSFRRLVYQMKTDDVIASGKASEIQKSIPLNLQCLFCKMQLSDTACSTKSLTVSFGWDDVRTIVQHDTQEFCRVLLDNLETKMKGTPELEGKIAQLLRGKYRSYVRCVHVNYESSRIEDFYDLSMTVKGCSNLDASFAKYVEKERLDGENQYDAGEANGGMQDAEMGVEFVQLPPVLQLHLRRFEYDFDFDRNIKINDRFEFPREINLDKYLAKDGDRSVPNIYNLYGVLVHSGTVSYGHYYAFLRTSTDTQWYEFNDSSVSKVTEEKAVDDNFGGTRTNSYNNNNITGINGRSKYYGSAYSQLSEKSFSAYVLIYVRQADAESIFEPIPNESIPQHLRDYVQNGCQYDNMSTKSASYWNNNDNDNNSNSIYNHNDNNNYNHNKTYEVSIVPEEAITENLIARTTGFQNEQMEKKFELREKATLKELYEKAAEEFNLPINKFRLWYFSNGTTPTKFIDNTDKPSALSMKAFFLQHKKPEEVLTFNISQYMLIFKFLVPTLKKAPFQFIGTKIIENTLKFTDLFIVVNEILGFPKETPLVAYREDSMKRVHLIDDNTQKLADSVILTGSVLIFQVKPGYPMPPSSFPFTETSSLTAAMNDNKNIHNNDICSDNNENNNKNNSNGDASNNDLPVYKYEFDNNDQTIESYYSVYITPPVVVTLYEYDSPNVAIAKIYVPPTMKLDALARFIVRSQGFAFNEHHDTLLIYKKDLYHDGPNSTPLSYSVSYHTVGSILPATSFGKSRSEGGGSQGCLFYKYVFGATKEDFEKRAVISCGLSMDALSIAKKIHIVVQKRAKRKDIIEAIRKKLNPNANLINESQANENDNKSQANEEKSQTNDDNIKSQTNESNNKSQTNNNLCNCSRNNGTEITQTGGSDEDFLLPEDDSNLRVLVLKGSKIVKILQDGNELGYNVIDLRVEIIPEDQRCIDLSERKLIQIATASVDSSGYAEPYGTPFFICALLDDTVATVKETIKGILTKLDEISIQQSANKELNKEEEAVSKEKSANKLDEKFAKAQLFVGDEIVKIIRKNALPDTQTIRDIDMNQGLYIVLNLKRASSSSTFKSEESLKIDN